MRTRLGSLGALALSAALAGCAGELPTRPSPAVPVVAAPKQPPRDAVVDWHAVAQRSAPFIVAIRVEHPIFEGAGGYGLKVLNATLNLASATPISSVFSWVEAVLLGYLDLVVAEGTGFLVSEDGLVLTNAHVVEGGETITASLSGGQVREGELIAISPEHDLALVQLRGHPLGERYPTATLRDPVGIGEEVAVFGFPSRPWKQSGNPITMTRGIVSSLGIDVGEAALRFQIDAAANAGASGSPVLGRGGAVLGIVTEHARPSVLEDQTFVIPSSEIIAAGFLTYASPEPPASEAPGGEE